MPQGVRVRLPSWVQRKVYNIFMSDFWKGSFDPSGLQKRDYLPEEWK